MGMFDYYKLSEEIKCPTCGSELSEWQGKEGPCALFVWQQGCEFPVDQKAGDECNFSINERKAFHLPDSFEIYSYDCPNHQPVVALCACENGVWSIIRVNE